MDAGADGRELRLLRGLGVDFQGAGDGRAGVLEDEHEGVTDLLDDAAVECANGSPDDFREALEDAGAVASPIASARGVKLEQVDEDHGLWSCPVVIRF